MKIMSSKTEHAFWEQRQNNIVSTKGGWLVGKGVFCHGYSMLDELVGQCSYLQVVVLNATGRLPERRLADWLEAVYICLSWPDPRIWCNQIGALGGTAQASAVAATCAGVLASDSRAYGPRTLLDGVNFIQQALQDQHRGLTVKQIIDKAPRHKGRPAITGYARPLAKGDERIPALERVTQQLGFMRGEHLTLAYQIEAMLRDKYDESMNINGFMSAFLLDQGYQADEIYQLFVTLVSSGVTACFVDTHQQPPESFLPLKCGDINYQGKPPREVPLKPKL